MRKTKFTRLFCLMLAFLLLVSGSALSSSAADLSAGSKRGGVGADLIADYATELGTIPYQTYMEEYADFFAAGSTKPRVDRDIVYDLSRMDLVFTDAEKNVITIKAADGSWQLKTPNGEVYNSVEAAIAPKGENGGGGFDLSDLVFITDRHYKVEEFAGQQVVYTPSTGETEWLLDLGAMGINAPTLSSIQLVYYPILTMTTTNANGETTTQTIGKSAAIERQFALGHGTDVASPFKEVHAIRLSKVWSSFRADDSSKSSALVGSYYPKKKESASAILSEGQGLGLVGTVGKDADGKEYVQFEKPNIITPAISQFIETYELRFFTIDADKNELRPSMQQTPEWVTYTLRDGDGFFSNDFGFVLQPDADGKIKLVLEGINEPMVISQIVLTPYETAVTYDEYLNNVNNNVGLASGGSSVKIEAENTVNTSTNVVYPVEDRTSPITSPTSTKKTMLNTIGTEKWATSGQWVEYQFSVDSSGMYDIYTRFKQSYLDGLYVCRSLQIFTEAYVDSAAYQAAHGNTYGYYNGVPFAEAAMLRYDYNTDWQVTALSDGGRTFQMYFEQGVVYTIRLEVTLGSKNDLVSEIEDILNNLNDDYLNILKLTGADPDDYRAYNFYENIPDTMINMYNQIDRLRNISTMLKQTAEVASTYSGVCDQLVDLLDRMVADESEVAKNLDNYKSYVGSLGTFLTDAKTQPLQVDYLLIQPTYEEAPKAEGNFFQRLWHEICAFFQSFFRDYNSMGAMENSTATENIEVWMVSGAATDEATYGRDQLQVVRNMCTNEFTNGVTEGRISVDLKLVTGGTLLPSILAGLGPDVYMGLAQGNVINYAIRGALQEIEGLEGFDQVTSQFNEAALIVLRMRDSEDVMHYYGLPETQQFPMMFVRIDILANLGVDIPETWDEVYSVQSMLEANNMEIGVSTNYKMFLYQMGGELFADDGMRINLDSQVGLTAFTKMCDMFTQYSFPYKYNAANRFRTGEMPIIISEYVGLYNQLKVFATELDGCWAFVPLPGIEDPVTGEINNASISTSSATVMIKGTENINASWEYMKWFTGDSAQAEFSNEMVAIIGDSAKHPTANISALENMPWTESELKQVKAQFNNLAAVPNYPGYYILDRYTNFAFLAAYNDDMDPTEELQKYINTINKEITRKREEFNLETLEIGQKLSDKRLAQAEEALGILKEKYNKDAYAGVFAAVEDALANVKISKASDYDSLIPLLQGLAADVMGFLPNEGEGTPSYFVRVSKQTSEEKDGGYAIDSLSEQKLLYFTAQCLIDAANALATY